MKRFSMLLFTAMIVFIGVRAHATIYKCSVTRISEEAQKNLGEFQLDSTKEEIKTVFLNENRDIAACATLPGEHGQISFVACMFADGQSRIEIHRPLKKGPPMIKKRNLRTGEIQSMPVALNDDQSSVSALMFPSVDKNSIFVTACVKTARR